MIMFGSNILSAADQLRKIQEEEFFHSLVSPKPELACKIRQLRVAYQIDPKQYSVQKRTLPYVVCGMFNPPFRRTENFGYIESFIIDIDHLGSKSISLSNLRLRLQADSRVLMAFASPSEDGLKLMFRLRERCYDTGIFSLFYKEFLRRLSGQYHLEQVADTRTSDVTRACFLSMDPDAFFNPHSEAVDIGQYLTPSDSLSLFDMKAKQAEEEKKVERLDKNRMSADPNDEIMEKIKSRLHQGQKTTKKKTEVYVPQRLNDIINDLKMFIEETGLIVSEIIDIQYGKKIRVRMGFKEAEVNLFYGKRGFTVVRSPRCGTSGEVNDLVAELIQAFIDTQ